jgi:hypothetical protein
MTAWGVRARAARARAVVTAPYRYNCERNAEVMRDERKF